MYKQYKNKYNDHRVITHLPAQSLNTPVFKKTHHTLIFSFHISYK